MWNDATLDAIKDIAISAGKEILDVYNSADQPDVTIKDDNSPLTDADRRAHRLIVEQLTALDPETPILSEESDGISTEQRLGWQRFWLVDPLDGTKEFVKRNGEFTVNIALIDGGEPVMGVVHVPVKGDTYLGKQGLGNQDRGAWKLAADGSAAAIRCDRLGSAGCVRVVASRSHRGELIDGLLELLEEKLGKVEVVSMGSSLKICLLAEGRADIYPRLAPTSEWDTAAAHAVLAAAGGEITDTGFQRLRYNQKADILNPHFIALADPTHPWSSLLGNLFKPD